MLMNEQNLKPIRSTEEAKQKGSAGGKKSGEVRKQRKAMKEQMELLLSLPVKSEEHKAFMETIGVDTENMDNQMMLMVSIFNKAMNGDLEAAKFCRDTVGEKPTDKVEQSGEVNNIVTIKTSKEVEEWGK